MASMNTPYNINEPSKIIIYQIDTAINFTYARKIPYIMEEVMTTSYDLIFVMGYCTDAC